MFYHSLSDRLFQNFQILNLKYIWSEIKPVGEPLDITDKISSLLVYRLCIYRNVADSSGHGQDHCELVGAQEGDSITIDNNFWTSPADTGKYRNMKIRLERKSFAFILYNINVLPCRDRRPKWCMLCCRTRKEVKVSELLFQDPDIFPVTSPKIAFKTLFDTLGKRPRLPKELTLLLYTDSFPQVLDLEIITKNDALCW